MIYVLQILNIIITGAITFIFTKKLNEQSQKFNNRLEKFKFQNSNIQLNALKHIELITTSRIQWIQELRENISILLTKLEIFVAEIDYVYDIILIGENNVQDSNEKISELLKTLNIFYYINKISLQLNKEDAKTDKKLIDSLEELELKIKSLLITKVELKYGKKQLIITKEFCSSQKGIFPIGEIKRLKIEIKEKSREILKKEWERVKEEIPKTINK